MTESSDVKNILGLQLPTDPRWVDLASISLEDILTDHAYCEQKAATSCISLIQRYSDKDKLVTGIGSHCNRRMGPFPDGVTGIAEARSATWKAKKGCVRECIAKV